MNCKKCGRPMGKNGLCGHCDRQKLEQMRKQPPKSKAPLYISLGAAAVLIVLVIALWAIFSGSDTTPTTDPATTPTGTSEAQVTEETPSISGKHHIEIEIQDYGTIAVELDADAAPITVENFLSLAESGFYNGLTFHRIMEGFMMQGGDPLGNGTGGSDETIKGEFSFNGVENNLSHTRGAISMARSSAYDSASSQFFICHADSTFLDGQYACFGYVTDGMDVVDAVCEAAQPTDSNGTIPASAQPIITTIRVID